MIVVSVADFQRTWFSKKGKDEQGKNISFCRQFYSNLEFHVGYPLACLMIATSFIDHQYNIIFVQ